MSSSLGRSGSTSAWRRIRARVLIEEPWCAVCGSEPSCEVDHIIERHHGGDDRRGNLRGVCRLCHAAKSASDGRREPRPSRDW